MNKKIGSLAERKLINHIKNIKDKDVKKMSIYFYEYLKSISKYRDFKNKIIRDMTAPQEMPPGAFAIYKKNNKDK